MTNENPNGSPLDEEIIDPPADEVPSPEVEALIAERDEYRDRFMRALADARTPARGPKRIAAMPSNMAARAWRATCCRCMTH